MSDVEYVYILTNPAMPAWVKVGKTNNIERRLKDLSKPTGVAEPFECYGFITVAGDKPDAKEVEKSLHTILSGKFTQSKEYFVASVSEIETYFLIVEKLNPRLKFSLYKQSKSKSKQTTFKILKITDGTELVYINDDSVRCIVANDKNKVIYNGNETSLSGIAAGIEKRPINGFERFTIAGSNETLWKRRKRLHPEV